MNNKPLSQPEAYKVADWLRKRNKKIGAVLKDIWRKTPSEIAEEYQVNEEDVRKAAKRDNKI
jgi:predicted transcriptional regulator